MTTNGNGAGKFSLSLFKNKFDTTPTHVERTWPEFCARIAEPQVRADKDGPLFAPATFDPPYRLQANVQQISELVFDFDHGADFDRDLAIWRERGYAFAAYTTHSSYRETEGNPDAEERFRLIIPLLEPINTLAEYRRLWKWAAEISGGKVDPQAKDASRMFYTPAIAAPGARYRYEIHNGLMLDWRALELGDPELVRSQQQPTQTGTSDAYGRRALENEVGRVAMAAPGGRNAQLNASAFALGQLVGGNVLTRFEVEDGLTRAASGAGLTDSEIKRTIQSGIEAGLREPRTAPERPRPTIARPLEPEPAGEFDQVELPEQDPEAGRFTPSATLLRPDEMSLMGLAAAFYERFYKLTRFVEHRNIFANYEDGVWTTSNVRIELKAQVVINEIHDKVTETRRKYEELVKRYAGDKEAAPKLAEAARYLKSLDAFNNSIKRPSTMDALMRFSRSSMLIGADDFDPDLTLFNCADGSIDLLTGTFRHHRPTDLCSMQSPVNYDPEAQCPRWIKFLNEIFLGDQSIIDFIQRAVGYSISGYTSEQKLLILHGDGSNGKGVLFSILDEILGTYAKSAAIDTFMDDKPTGGHNEDIARLRGCRMVMTSETEKSRKLAEALIKRLTGEDVITASYKHERTFEYKPRFTIWMAANHKPVIHGTDNGIWRRILLVPFYAFFYEPKDAEKIDMVRSFPVDPDLHATLRQEMPGILNWAIEGFKQWREQRLNPPESIVIASNQYRSESDKLGAFLEDRLIKDDDMTADFAQVYLEYEKWCEDGGMRPQSKISLSKEMAVRGMEIKRAPGGRRSTTVYGWGLLD